MVHLVSHNHRENAEVAVMSCYWRSSGFGDRGRGKRKKCHPSGAAQKNIVEVLGYVG
jgi:hypothetical protein